MVINQYFIILNKVKQMIFNKMNYIFFKCRLEGGTEMWFATINKKDRNTIFNK